MRIHLECLVHVSTLMRLVEYRLFRAPILLVLSLLAFQPACSRNSPARPAEQRLQDFEGVIDNSGVTHDPVKSDLYVRASQALQDGDAEAAEALYREVVAKYPNDPESYEALGACLYIEARYNAAKAEYLHALQLNGRSVGALYGLGCVAHKQKLYDEAIEHRHDRWDSLSSETERGKPPKPCRTTRQP